MEIPSVKGCVAAAIVAEMGVDMSVFARASHLAAWAGLCPGNNRSTNKRRGEPIRKGNVPLQSMLVEAAADASTRTRYSSASTKYCIAASATRNCALII